MLDAEIIDGPIREEILGSFATHGFRASEQARYIVQFTLSDVPGKTGLFAPTGNPDTDTRWLIAPSRSRSISLRAAILTISDRTTGQELYRIAASEPLRENKSASPDGIVQLLMAELRAGLDRAHHAHKLPATAVTPE